MKIAVVGLGFMGATHITALKQIPQAQLFAVVSADPVKLHGDLSAISGNLGRQGEKLDFSKVRKYTTVEECLADPDVEAVDVCLPTHLHGPVTLAALRARKHVLVEKPMALNAAEAEEMIRVAQESGKTLMVAQVLRFFPMYTALRHTLPGLGTVHSAFFRRRCAGPAWARWITDAGKSGGGVFDLLIHDVDMMIHLFGYPEEVSAVGYEELSKGVDVIEGRFHYANGLTVVVTGGWHHPKAYPFSMEYTVVAEGGTVEFSSAGRAPTLYTAEGAERPLALSDKDGFLAELEYFVGCLAAGRQPEQCPPEESAAATQLTLRMVEARNKQGERISCRD